MKKKPGFFPPGNPRLKGYCACYQVELVVRKIGQRVTLPGQIKKVL